MSDDIKKQLGAVIDSYKEDLCQMADEIFDLAEISGEEYKTSDILCSYLEKEGFVIERGTGLETAFRATWDNGSDGPVIGILVEYDALEKSDMRVDIIFRTCRNRGSNRSKELPSGLSMQACCVWNSGRGNSWR